MENSFSSNYNSEKSLSKIFSESSHDDLKTKEYVKEFQKEIEKKFKNSITNQKYNFPRKKKTKNKYNKKENTLNSLKDINYYDVNYKDVLKNLKILEKKKLEPTIFLVKVLKNISKLNSKYLYSQFLKKNSKLFKILEKSIFQKIKKNNLQEKINRINKKKTKIYNKDIFSDKNSGKTLKYVNNSDNNKLIKNRLKSIGDKSKLRQKKKMLNFSNIKLKDIDINKSNLKNYIDNYNKDKISYFENSKKIKIKYKGAITDRKMKKKQKNLSYNKKSYSVKNSGKEMFLSFKKNKFMSSKNKFLSSKNFKFTNYQKSLLKKISKSKIKENSFKNTSLKKLKKNSMKKINSFRNNNYVHCMPITKLKINSNIKKCLYNKTKNVVKRDYKRKISSLSKKNEFF